MSNTHNYISDAEHYLLDTIAALEAALNENDNIAEQGVITVLIRTASRLLTTIERL